MSEYEYMNGDRRLSVGTALRSGCVYVTAGPTDVPLYGMWIPNADAPTVAAELLKAAGQEGVFVAAGDTPTYTVRGNYLHFLRPDGKEHAIGTYESAEDLTRVARYNLVAAEYIESKAQRETEATEKNLQERRDALVAELDGGADYDEFHETSPFRRAIDRIIELEDGQADA